MMRSR
ncbi:hypothetical protein EYF80_064100 [Liparis tanakae]